MCIRDSLIRNAVDHGIEAPEERVRCGKSPRGTVILRAFNDINSVVIQIEDDGKGINWKKIRDKCIEKGLISEAEAGMLSEREILDYIFQPGFSTAETITDISGRGVGMDVVRTSVKAMSGTIDIDTEIGRGTCFIIRLPLAITILDALIIQAKNETYSIPTDSVERILRIPPDNFKSIYQQRMLSLRNRTLPYKHLSDIIGYGSSFSDSPSSDETGNILSLILKSNGKPVALGVDKILGKQKVVIKNLGSFFNVPGISGASIQGDGSVMLVLNAFEMSRIIQSAG